MPDMTYGDNRDKDEEEITAGEGTLTDEDTKIPETNIPDEGFDNEDSQSGETADTADQGSSSGGTRQFRGLYRYVHISLKTLDRLIIGLGIALIVCMAIGLSNRGYLVTFDSLGGTTVESQKYLYDELIVVEEEPTREGYRFTGWYKNADLEDEWDMENDVVIEPMTLYAGWEEE